MEDKVNERRGTKRSAFVRSEAIKRSDAGEPYAVPSASVRRPPTQLSPDVSPIDIKRHTWPFAPITT